VPETYEQTRDRLRSKFVQELYNLQKVPVDMQIARISEVDAQSPVLTWQMGDSFNKMVKVTTQVDNNPNARIPKPTISYKGALRAYTHPDTSVRMLPSVPEFVYNQVSANSLVELVDKRLLQSNILWAFPNDALPASTPDFENGSFKFWQPDSINVAPDVFWNPPLNFFAESRARIRKFTGQVPNGWTIVQRILPFAGVNHTFNVILAPTTLTYVGKTLNDAGYDAQDLKINATIIRIYAEKSVTVFLFNQRYKMDVSDLYQIQWVAVMPSDTGLEWKHLATEVNP
jgi:hypothetical protein